SVPKASKEGMGAPKDEGGAPKEASGAGKDGSGKPGKDGSPTNPGPEQDRVGMNKPGGPPPQMKTARIDKDNSTERWGDLPIQVREVFRTEGGEDMPPQYRDWIDGYYRRLLELK
ncbi:MAG TPA: hypothetical protein VM509_11775, partial [Planctomycetota bacterium]|nr:hypothetical protein [Planctomycetota bacterium]